MTSILVVGCAPGSFGRSVADMIATELEDDDWNVVYSGLPGTTFGAGRWIDYDVTWEADRHLAVMNEVHPHHVVYAVGLNEPDGAVLEYSAEAHLRLNLFGFLRVAEAFKTVSYPGSQLVAVSSNSARIPRSPSLGYCLSKAALSMAVRTLARKWGGEPLVWGVEPGLMNTEATVNAVNLGLWGEETHRMRGVHSRYGLNATQLAEVVAHLVLWGGTYLNGTLVPLDAGEL